MRRKHENGKVAVWRHEVATTKDGFYDYAAVKHADRMIADAVAYAFERGAKTRREEDWLIVAYLDRLGRRDRETLRRAGVLPTRVMVTRA